ncbi:MAG: tetratricopeptide repeat protein [Oscillospiraceae bacterium]|jgi:tetratricopeptide (TPR) repeat protein|nr:tetratricopeptide repeat protein [Oscillospiraceae bacterium]
MAKTKENPIFAQLAAMYTSAGNEDIEKLITGGVEMMEKNKEDEMPEYFALLWELANFYRGLPNPEKATETYKKALSKMRDFHMEESQDFLMVYNAYGELLRQTGDYGAASEIFAQALKIAENNDKPNDQAALLRSLSLVARASGDLKKAAGYADREIALLRDGAGEANDLAAALSGAAIIKHSLRDYDAAEALVNEAVKLFEGLEHVEARHGAALSTFAAIRYIKGDLDGAREAYIKAAQLIESFFGKNSQVISIYESIAKIYEAQGDTKTALTYLKPAFKASKGNLGAEHEQTRALKENITALKTRRFK